MQVSIVALTGFIFIMVFANSLGMLVAGQVLCGIPWGVFQTLTTAYAAEVSQNQRSENLRKNRKMLISGLPYPTAGLPRCLCQSLLGCRYPLVIRCCEGLSAHRQRLVMANSLHRPVGMDPASFRHRLVRSSVPLVACPKGSVRRG